VDIRILIILAISILLVATAVLPPTSAGSSSDIYLYVFGTDECSACRYFKEWLYKNYTDTWYFCDLSNPDCRSRFSYLNSIMGFPIEIIPTTVVVNATVRAVVIGAVTDASFWSYLMKIPIEGSIPIYQGKVMIAEISNPKVREIIKTEIANIQPSYSSGISTSCIEQSCSIVSRVDYYYVATSIATLDSINPCVFLSLSVLVTIAFLVGGKERAVASGISFTTAVFVSYLLLGVILFRFVALIPRITMPIIAVIFGVLSILNAVSRYRRTKLIGWMIEAYTPSFWSALIGFTTPFTLLPCTDGPYVLFVRVMNDLSIEEALKYIVLYDAIFIMPLLILTLFGCIIFRIERVVKRLEHYEKMFRLVGGITLVILGAIFIR